MGVSRVWRTIDLARAAGISVQQVRNYEALGLIPTAERSKSGYRLYTERHDAALRTARGMMGGFGRQGAEVIMVALHRGDLAAALTTIDTRHAELAGRRQQIEQTLAALRKLAMQDQPVRSSRYGEQLRVGDAAKRLGVRVSALHYWEQQGLLQPSRDRDSRYRVYDEQQMRRLRMVVLLREAGYDLNALRPVVEEAAAGRPERAIAAAETRLEALTRTSWACVEATTLFHSYVADFCGGLR